jgi:hypothetical protein
MSPELELACHAAREAGVLLRANFETELRVDALDRHDIKLALDVESQKLIEGLILATFPNHAIYGALITGWVSIPLLFHYPSASLFNHYLVTAAPPEIGDADTCLEVGMWAWAWMEPSTGALSFFLLCMQFAREQSIAIGGDSFHGRLAEWQGKRLAAAYPEYDYKIVHAYGAIRAHLDDTNDLLREQLEIEALLLKAEPEESPAVPER